MHLHANVQNLLFCDLIIFKQSLECVSMRKIYTAHGC